MKLALMIIDMQNAYCTGEAVEQMAAASEYINYVIPKFEAKGLPIIWVYNVDEEDGSVPGSDAFEFIDALKPGDGQIKVHKTYSNTFNKTDADAILKEHGVDTIVMTGYCAENCVLSTYRGARDLDYFPVILKDGIASGKEENKQFVQNISETITAGMLVNILGDQ
jgi:nicotinamidase-related amidase